MKLHRAFLNVDLRPHEGVENRLKDIAGVFLEFHQPPVIVDVGVTEPLKLGDKVEIAFGEEKSFARVGILAQINNHVVDKDAGVHGPATPVGESLAGFGHSKSFGDDFPELAVAPHVQEMISTRILNVTAQKCYFVADFDHASFPSERLD